MQYIIVEDELPARTWLSGLVKELRPEWELVCVTTNVVETIDWLNTHTHPDLMFLDIQLSDGNGFDIFKKLDYKGLVIFTTAYDEYAIQAFQVNSIDYLLKPISSNALLTSIEKFEYYTQSYIQVHNQAIDYNTLADAVRNAHTHYRTKFLICSSDRYYQLPVADIAYFYSENRITFAVIQQGKEVPINLSLEKLEAQLDPNVFFRINRQIIARDQAIQTISNWFNNKLTIHLIPEFKEKVIVSRERAPLFKQWLDH